MDEESKSLELIENQDAIQLVPTWDLEWWWVAIGGAALVLIILFVVLLVKAAKRHPLKNIKREAYQEALAALSKLEPVLGKKNAIEISVILRSYLAKSMNDPALYETHEEFVGRHDAIKDLNEELKVHISGYFSELAGIKYGPDEEQQVDHADLKQRAINLLERIYTA